MEYGLIAKVDQFSDNRSLEIQKVQKSSETSKITQNDELKQIKQENIDSEKQVSEMKKTELAKTPLQFEFTLTNTNFGFNDSSKDFYVKATRGNVENQYPTESMMRLKSYLISLNDAS